MSINMQSKNKYYRFFFAAALFVVAAAANITSAQTAAVLDTVKQTDVTVSNVKNAETESAGAAAAQSSSSSSDWTGVYIGGYLGGNFNRSSANTSTVFNSSGYFAASSVTAINSSGAQKLDPNGFTGGATLGYNYQSGRFLIGAETDFGALTGKKTATTTTVYPCCSPTSFTIAQSVKTDWIFTARPRVGVIAGNALFYGTGGLAVTKIDYNARFTDNFATANESGAINKTRAGWTAGGGVEYKVANKWSVKGEYLFADFRRATTTSTNLTAFTPPTAYPSNVFTHSIYSKNHMLRFGVNYHF